MAKHERTLAAIFADPIQANIRWGDVEALFLHLGAIVTEGSGSTLTWAEPTRRSTAPTPAKKRRSRESEASESS